MCLYDVEFVPFITYFTYYLFGLLNTLSVAQTVDSSSDRRLYLRK